MAEPAAILPLFPLHAVLFPGGRLPLHVFERRYRLMLAHCLETSAPFGVVAIRSGVEVGGPADPYPVGTSARPENVRRLDDGRYLLVAAGERRFRILDLVRDLPYARARVEWLEEVEEGGEEALVARLRELFHRCRAALGAAARADAEPDPRDAVAWSYHVAAALPVPLPERQALLATDSLRQRLQREIDLLSQQLAIAAAVRQGRHHPAGRGPLSWN